VLITFISINIYILSTTSTFRAIFSILAELGGGASAKTEDIFQKKELCIALYL
jgi:hypothetical protein